MGREPHVVYVNRTKRCLECRDCSWRTWPINGATLAAGRTHAGCGLRWQPLARHMTKEEIVAAHRTDQ